MWTRAGEFPRPLLTGPLSHVNERKTADFLRVALLSDAYQDRVQLTHPNSLVSMLPSFGLALGFDIVDDLL